jgi:acetaldehyde dehydrogenase (acetylating)
MNAIVANGVGKEDLHARFVRHPQTDHAPQLVGLPPGDHGFHARCRRMTLEFTQSRCFPNQSSPPQLTKEALSVLGAHTKSQGGAGTIRAGCGFGITIFGN